MPRWTILIATLGQRSSRFQRLLDVLLPQVEEYGGDVQVVAYWNNFERPLGEIRQALVEHATGQYISFIDDDDLIPPYHCAEVYPRLDGEVHYIGWQLELHYDGRLDKPSYHSLRYDRWWDDDAGYYRHVSHLNPVRRDLALKADYRVGKGAEDVSWVNQMTEHLKTEHYIDRSPMYIYHYSSADSTWTLGGRHIPVRDHVRPIVDHSYFSYHPDSSRGA